MRRFVSLIMLAAGALLALWYLYYCVGLYLPADNASLSVPFKAEGEAFYIRNAAGTYEELTIRAVEVSDSLPGRYATEFALDEEAWLDWFTLIAEMGANTVKPTLVMRDCFYNALYTYNTSHEEPLYLLQQISLPDAENYGPDDAWSEDYAGRLRQDARNLVDIIHGRKTILVGELGGSGGYRRDISQWTIGFVLGTDWSADTIAYTDHETQPAYDGQGEYFRCDTEATSFERMLAWVMEETAAYETDKYGAQHPIAFVSSPEYDFLEYDDNYALQLKKYAYLDSEHVRASEAMQAGTFAAYRLFDYCDEILRCLSAEQLAALGDAAAHLDEDAVYGGYMGLLSAHHTMPVLAVGYGFSSARGAVKIGQEPLEEAEQGEQLLMVWRESLEQNWAGVCVSTWQDCWEQKTWNTSFAVNMQRRNVWQNLQTEGQGYGLLAFEPGQTTSVCTLDGDAAEWEAADIVAEQDGLTLSARYDWRGLYLLIEGESVSEDTALYVPVDITDESGAATADGYEVSFDRAADFLLCLNGQDNTRLLVQERYHAMRENFLYDIESRDPFSDEPEIDGTTFVTIGMALTNPTLLENYADIEISERRELTALGVWDTGVLTHGCGDPESEEYSSLADFCFGDHTVEIRIPWMLLNVSDPSLMLVHRDYYTCYGVESKSISRIWLGVGGTEAEISLQAFSVRGTGRKPAYHERLKKSYYILQEAWRNPDVGD